MAPKESIAIYQVTKMAARTVFAAASLSENSVVSCVIGASGVTVEWVKGERMYVRQYEWQFLLDTHNKVSCYDKHLLSELGLLRRVDPRKATAAPGATLVRNHRKRCSRMRKWGKRGGVYARLIANPHKPAVPTLMLANVCSLDNKMDYIRVWRASQRSVRNCCLRLYGDLAEPEHHVRCDPAGGANPIQSWE